MKAITLYQPWATWVIKGIKTIETRTHDRFKSLVGDHVLIHAGKKMDKLAQSLHRAFIPDRVLKGVMFYPFGVLLGAVLVRESRALTPEDSTAACFDIATWGGDGLTGLILSDVHELKKPVPWKGARGIFEVPDDVIGKILDRGFIWHGTDDGKEIE